MLQILGRFIDVYGLETVDQLQYKATKVLIEENQVIISVYGDCNVGKSTLLNGILGERYIFVLVLDH